VQKCKSSNIKTRRHVPADFIDFGLKGAKIRLLSPPDRQPLLFNATQHKLSIDKQNVPPLYFHHEKGSFFKYQWIPHQEE
jgi:hypothetical protein